MANSDYIKKLSENFENIINNSKKNNISSILSINTKPEDFQDHLNLIKDLYNNDADTALSTNSVSLSTSIEVKATDPGLTVTVASNNAVSTSDAKEGDVITVANVDYTIRVVMPDGTGMTEIMLEKDPWHT